MKEMYPAIVNSPMTELTNDIDAVQTSIEIEQSIHLPDAPNLAMIGIGEDAETILYTAKTGSTLSGITRGFQSDAKAWSKGMTVARMFTAYDYDTLIYNITSVDDKADGAIKESEKGAVGGVAKQDDFTSHVGNGAAHGIGDKSTLLTTNKSTIVGAMNELFTNANNLKTDWAGVVGSPLLPSDTSAQLKSKTQTIKNKGATNLTAKGVTANGNEALDALMGKIAQIETGKKWASGTALLTGATLPFEQDGYTETLPFITVSNLDFMPKTVLTSGYSAIGTTTDIAMGGSTFINDRYATSRGGNFSHYLITGNLKFVQGGFTVPVINTSFDNNVLINWIAYE